MHCPACDSLIDNDRIFCPTCQAFVANPGVGIRASLFDRINAHLLSGILMFAVLTLTEAYVSNPLTKTSVLISYILIMFGFYSRALSPGKYILRLRVIDVRTGKYATFFTMIMRDVFYKLISALALSIGYIWAFFDPDTQTWHDKLAKTVVVKEVLPILSPEFTKV